MILDYLQQTPADMAYQEKHHETYTILVKGFSFFLFFFLILIQFSILLTFSQKKKSLY